MITEAEVRDALRVCYDPELQVNAVDLGRVHEVRVVKDTNAVGPDARASVVVEMLPRDEQQDGLLAAQIQNRLLGIREISEVRVELIASKAWTADCMNDAARAELGRQQGLVQLR